MKYLLTILFFYTAVAGANVIGHDVQNFNPLTSGLDFITVHSSETLRPCTINCGVFLNYAKNSLPNFDIPLDSSKSDDHTDSLISSDINVGIGLTRRWDLGFSVSTVHSQDVDSNVQGIEYEETGLTDIRVNTKYRISGDYDGGFAVILGAAWNQTTNNPYTGKDNGPTINIQLAADTMLASKVSLAANVGYRIKDSGDPILVSELCKTTACQTTNGVVEPFGDSFVGSLAANYFVEDWNTKFIGELYGSMPVEEAVNTTEREQTTLELLVGVKKDFTDKFSGHLGVGGGILNGSASPDVRVYSGINYVLGPMTFCESSERPVIAKIEEDQDPAEAILAAEEAPPEPVEEPIEEPVEDEEVFVIRDVLFDTNKHFLRPEAAATIKDVAEKLQRPGGFKHVIVEGHTDSRMPEAYNQALSERRANSVMKRLIKLGVPKDKISAEGKGELTPIADNGNPQGRALNRRVEFRVRWR